MKVLFSKENMRQMIRDNQKGKLKEKSEREFSVTRPISFCVEDSHCQDVGWQRQVNTKASHPHKSTPIVLQNSKVLSVVRLKRTEQGSLPSWREPTHTSVLVFFYTHGTRKTRACFWVRFLCLGTAIESPLWVGANESQCPRPLHPWDQD